MRAHLAPHAIAAVILSVGSAASAHGIVGNRFFPSTPTVDDPLVTDELALPSLSLAYIPASDGSPETRALSAGFEFSKVILPRFSVGVATQYNWLTPRGQSHASGWDNLELSLKYQLWESAPHEAVLSIGLESDLGGTGSRSIGRESFSSFTPTLFFGKGFGDLPDSLDMLKPMALTGALGLSFPTESQEPNSLQWGLSLEYNIPYLQQHVQDLHLPEPFKHLIPLVEFDFQTPLNRGTNGFTTGTINPGFLYETRYFQFALELAIPINHDSGSHLGAIASVEIYIDDLLPQLFGHPLFGD